MDATEEQRQHPRVNVMDAVVVTPNGHGHETHVLDISMGGARVAAASGLSPSTGAPLKILFLAQTDTPIMLQAHVARVTTDALGLAFDAAQDANVQDLLDVLGRRP
jgi:hypothetical protein